MLSVREIQSPDIDLITDYWLGANPAFLEGMGVDRSKMPSREQWQEMLMAQLGQAYPEKQSYCTIWELDGVAVGHCNVNKIVFGEEAYMHLHMWQPSAREKGLGTAFVQLSLPYFFRNLALQRIYCEPYALNPAPNKTLEKLGFQLLKSVVTTPGWLNFEQAVHVWVLERIQTQ